MCTLYGTAFIAFIELATVISTCICCGYCNRSDDSTFRLSSCVVKGLSRESMADYNPGFRAKGKSGQRKRYYTGTKQVGKKRKKGPEQNLCAGDVVVYQFEEKVFRGCIKEILGTNTRIVAPNPTSPVETIITSHESPVLLSTLRTDLFHVLQDVLVVWDESNSYTALIPGTVFSVEDDHAWVIVPQQYSKHALKCFSDDICVNPFSANSIHESSVSTQKHFSLYDTHVIDAVLSSTRQELSEMKSCYEDACQQISRFQTEAESLHEDNRTLIVSHTQALSRVEQLETDLEMNYDLHVEDYKKIKALRGIIDIQNKTLKHWRLKVLTTQDEIRNLQVLYEQQRKDLEETRQQLAVTKHKLNLEIIKNKRLTSMNEELVSGNQAMAKEIEIEKMKKLCTNNLELMAASSQGKEGCVVLTRESGSKERLVAMVPIPKARVGSKDASLKTLENRAKVLSKIINALSSTEKASEEDSVKTLSAYFRPNPSLLTQTCDAAGLNVIKEISPAEAVDMKVLLRLPMNRVRELRTFLGNLGIKILPSESLMYSELLARNQSYNDSIEIGTVLLKKTVSAEKPTDITFVKVKSLVGHIQKAVSRLANDDSFTTDGIFEDKLWLKIGGDKGGSTTKLATQVGNISDCNSPDRTELIGMFEATDSYNNLKTIFGSFAQDFVDIQKKFSFQLGTELKECEVFLFGDYEFLCKVLGHMGASASYPCLWCHVKLSDLANNQGPHSPMIIDPAQQRFVPNPEWPRKRTPDDYVNDLANNKLDQRGNGDMRVNGARHHSIAKEPVLPIVTDMDNVVPPSLHILLGLVVRYYKYLETVCRTLDHGTIGERDVALHKQWETSSIERERQTWNISTKMNKYRTCVSSVGN